MATRLVTAPLASVMAAALSAGVAAQPIPAVGPAQN